MARTGGLFAFAMPHNPFIAVIKYTQLTVYALKKGQVCAT
ncbi:hypothetical protein ABIB90_006210 [Bradyrhizobium sp. JR4.1]